LEPVQVAERIRENFPSEVLSVGEFRGQVSVLMGRQRILDVCRFLHDEPELDFDLLRDLTGVDHLGRKQRRFEVVYHLYSIRHKHFIRLKAQVPEDDCRIQSVMPVWVGADWHERECYDMFGIVFEGHPDLRRILMPEDWEGHPFRKDYPLRGPGPESEWRGFREVLDKAERFKKYEWNNE
jgi:NADH-quinone oxidoreductase subunit C